MSLVGIYLVTVQMYNCTHDKSIHNCSDLSTRSIYPVNWGSLIVDAAKSFKSSEEKKDKHIFSKITIIYLINKL